MRTRRITYLVAALALLVVALAVYLTTTGGHLPQATSGRLSTALANYGATHGVQDGGDPHAPASQVISDSASHPAQVTGTQVTWYTTDGTEYTTTVASADSLTKQFSDDHFYNFRISSSSGGNLLVTLLLPNLLLVALAAGIIVLLVLLLRRSRRARG